MIRGTTALVAHIVPMGCREAHFPDLLRAVFAFDNFRGALITMPHDVLRSAAQLGE